MSFFGGPDEGGVRRIDKSAMKVKLSTSRNVRGQRSISQISHHVAPHQNYNKIGDHR